MADLIAETFVRVEALCAGSRWAKQFQSRTICVFKARSTRVKRDVLSPGRFCGKIPVIATLSLTEEQVLQLVKQLPPQSKRRVLSDLTAERDSWWQSAGLSVHFFGSCVVLRPSNQIRSGGREVQLNNTDVAEVVTLLDTRRITYSPF
jgi:hypothetical protein